MATKRSVVLNGYDLVQVNENGVAGEAIKPGYLVKGVSAILKQTATTGSCPVAVALERDELGQGIDSTHKTSAASGPDYASGDTVKVGVCPGGVILTGFVGSGENIAEDQLLESAGNGLYRAGTTKPIARSLDSTGGEVFAVTTIRVQVL